MADAAPRRLTAVLLGAAAPALVAGGLLLAGGALGTWPSPADDPSPSPAVVAVSEHARTAPSSTAAPSPATARATADPGVRPDVVVVPELGVRAPVTGIRTVDGALTPPDDPSQVGWWTGGARPGASTGAAVVTGHTVRAGGGAFDDLETLTAGDEVLVRSGTRTVPFVVDSVEVLSREQLARRSASLFSRSGSGRLVLITCEDWDGTSYRSNVVVTARRG
ncbi:class F sortase [Nocardioides flavus (ex Wang et al. 2016)]|uniref:class F sortase n=1 Tax=Nocardioides flavus (ex Wang et al. 2016) TaxID=2058780 RepID=UPI001E5CBD38|nr:class F sortase [Nocardioides flavus (ex Wang et al. 2016)]